MGFGDARVQLEYQRGQTLPFWAIGTVVVLAMMFFLANYVNVVTWNMRAQTAADSFASETLGIQSNLYNEYSTLTYAASVDEYRLRYLNQAILNTIDGVGGCSNADGSCNRDYVALVQEYNAAYTSYDKLVQLMRQGETMTQAGITSDQQKAEKQMGAACTDQNDYTCSFTASVIGRQSVNSPKLPDAADVVACRKVTYFVPQLLKLGSGAKFKAMARSAAAIVPVSTQVFNAGTEVNPVTGHVFQPLETPAPDTFGSYAVDFSGMTATVHWYAPAPVRPFGGTIDETAYQC